MSTSKSPDFPKLEAAVMRYLGELALNAPQDTVTASAVSAALDVSARVIREVLSRLSNRGFLTPRLVMSCSDCGVHSDEQANESSIVASCHVCGQETEHNPVVVFDLSAAMRSAYEGESSPKFPSRKKTPVLKRLMQSTRANMVQMI